MLGKLSVILFLAVSAIGLPGCLPVLHLRSVQKAESGYKIKPGDTLHVRFIHYPNLTTCMNVDASGDVSFSDFGNVHVSGMTAEQLKSKLMNGYSKLLAVPEIEITVENPENRTVYFGGEVKSPGVFHFRENMSIAQGLLLAGGLTGAPLTFKIVVFRGRPQGRARTFKIDLSKGGSAARLITDFKLAPDDVVFVVKADLALGDPGVEI